MPWWSALLLGVVLYLIVGQLLPRSISGSMAHVLGPTLSIAGLLLVGACVIGALLGLIVRLKEKLLYGSQGSLNQICALSGADFEHLMAEAFRAEGFVANLTDPGPDGGVDLVLMRNGERWLVQCKQWRTQRVGVKPLRELAGVVSAAGAAGAIFVCSGDYTAEARSFAEQAGIRLIDGRALSRMMALGCSAPSLEPASSICPRCGGQLVQRIARRGSWNGQSFLGCSSFPRCRYKREA